MTRMVTDKALLLLAKAVSDLEGNEKKVADALIAELKANTLVLGGVESSPLPPTTAVKSLYSLELVGSERSGRSLH